MKLRWKRRLDGLAQGFDGEGNQLAQVARTHAGWTVQLHAEGELFDQFDTPEEAMAAAETAVDPNRGLASDEYE